MAKCVDLPLCYLFSQCVYFASAYFLAFPTPRVSTSTSAALSPSVFTSASFLALAGVAKFLDLYFCLPSNHLVVQRLGVFLKLFVASDWISFSATVFFNVCNVSMPFSLDSVLPNVWTLTSVSLAAIVLSTALLCVSASTSASV